MRTVALLLAGTGVVGLIVASAITLADVALRFWGVPIDGMNEVAALVVTVSIAFFIPLTLSEDHNLTIGYLGRFLGGLRERLLNLLGATATLFFFGVICWRLLLYAVDTFQSAESTPMARLPIFPVWWLVALAFVVGVLIQVYVVARRLRRTASPPSDEPPAGDRSGQADASRSDSAVYD